jgi:hypothetical protein
LEDWKYAKVTRDPANPNPPTIQELVGLENLPADWTTPVTPPTFFLTNAKLSAKQPQNLPETPKTSWETTMYNLGFRTTSQSQNVSAIKDTTKSSWNLKDTLTAAGFLTGSLLPPPVGTIAGAEYDVKVSGEPRLIAYPANLAGDIVGYGGGAIATPAGPWVSVPVNIAGQIGGTEGAYAVLKPFESKAKAFEKTLTPQKIVSGILSGASKLIPTYPTTSSIQLIKKPQTAVTKVQAPTIISQKEVSKAVELKPTSTIQKVTKTPIKTEQVKISPTISVSKGVQVTYGKKIIKKK